MSVLKKLASDTAYYGLSSIVGRVLNFLLFPFYTGIFFAEDYGIMSDFYAKAAIFNVIYIFGMETAYFRFSSKQENKPEEVYRTAVSAVMLCSLFFSSLLILFSQPLADLMQYPDRQIDVILFALLFAVDAIVAIPFARLRQENKAKKFAFVKVGNILINIGLNIFFLYVCQNILDNKSNSYFFDLLFPLIPLVEEIYYPEYALRYVFAINLIANLLQVLFIRETFKNFRFQIQYAQFKEMFVYSYPLLFMGLAGAVNEVLDRDLLKYWLPENFYEGKTNLEAVGIYSACYKLSIFISLAVQAFRYAGEPFFFSKAANKNSPPLFAKVMRYFVIALTFMYLAVSVNLDILQSFLRKDEYREGIGIVPFLLLANLFLGIYYNLTIWFKVTDKTYFSVIFSGIGASITVLGNLLLIPILGYMGSAVVTLLCYFTMSALCYVYGQKYYPIPYPLKAIFAYIGFASGLIFTAAHFDFGGILNFFFHNGLVLVFLGVVYGVERGKFIEKKEL
ncbi:MAG: polysaccharide biosynthesis protein [Cytophagales bacterium]|nr:MAG: polysaccharide biosynthesis protein [Cytophagales bacterium]